MALGAFGGYPEPQDVLPPEGTKLGVWPLMTDPSNGPSLRIVVPPGLRFTPVLSSLPSFPPHPEKPVPRSAVRRGNSTCRRQISQRLASKTPSDRIRIIYLVSSYDQWVQGKGTEAPTGFSPLVHFLPYCLCSQ
ncbi:hypothetical protein P7K49_028516 [Saguinus oedipus]|uniref:Uncharacterized protein n=1 Tax=Saguinus oedipus TaxID=9490 RepID=A0ABQ9U5R3_SAGOE|nr:hypothetical protein P7K49_028516 [Saguinus oedipus]